MAVSSASLQLQLQLQPQPQPLFIGRSPLSSSPVLQFHHHRSSAPATTLRSKLPIYLFTLFFFSSMSSTLYSVSYRNQLKKQWYLYV